MKETIEFRINYDFANLLFKEEEGKNIGTSVKVVELSKEDPRYKQIPIISKQIKEEYDRSFFFGWKIKRKYSKKELEAATLFQMKIKNVFEPTGEECGTLYDEKTACEICGSNRTQIGILKLKKNSILKKDIAKTIGGEVIVSENFLNACKERNLRGLTLKPIVFNETVLNYQQLFSINELQLSEKTIAGNDPFETSIGSNGGSFNISGYDINLKKEVYKCPEGHLIGLNLLSEAYVFNNPVINGNDFFSSNQKIGVRRGLLQPESIYFCSQDFKRMVEEEKLSGFDFEIARIE